MGLEITVLGRVAVALDGAPVPLRPGRAKAILARLALDNGRAVPREALIAALWADDPPASAVNVVQVAVSTLRRELGAGAVLTDPVGYALGPAVVDLDAFSREVRLGLRAVDLGDDVGAAAALAPAVDRFRPPLEDLGLEPFVEPWRASLTERYLIAVEARAAALVRLGQADTALHLLQELVGRHPLREALLEQLMLALAAAGREAEALAAYDAGRRRIADELGVDPGSRLRGAYERILRQELPPQGSAAAHRLRTGLRTVPPPAIGRAAELAELGDLLDRHDTRLITLVGPGGIGKTRLAEALVESAAERSAFASVVGVSDADALAEAIVAAVLVQRPSGPPLTSLVDALRTGTASVLVLDDLEVADGARQVVGELLSRVPLLRIVATSRQPLALSGEVRYAVPPLSTDAEGATWSPAVLLLRDRIVRARGGRALEDDAGGLLTEVAELCDGVPLALELAASATSVVGLPDLPARLRRGQLQDPGSPDWALPVGAALRSSVAGLPADGEAVLRAAAVFPDPADVMGLEAVSDRSRSRTEAALQQLLGRGLLREAPSETGPRFRLLVPVRESVLEGMSAEEAELLRDRFIGYETERFCAHAWYERAPRTFAEVSALRTELGNLQAALDLVAERDPVRSARLVARLAWASTVLAIGEVWRRRRAAALATDLPDEERFDLLVAAAADDAELTEASAIAERLRDPARSAWLAFRLARAVIDRGDLAAAAAPVAVLAAADATVAGPAREFLRARRLDVEQMLLLKEGAGEESLARVDDALIAAAEQEREIETVLLEAVRIEVLTAAGRYSDAADDALDLLDAAPGAGPWLRGSILSVRGVALLRQGRPDLALEAQRTAVGLLLGSPWRIEQLEVLLRWAGAAMAEESGSGDSAFVLGLWRAAMARLTLAAWPIERALAAEMGASGPDAAAMRAGEQSVRLLGPARAVEEAMRGVLDERRLARRRGAAG